MQRKEDTLGESPDDVSRVLRFSQLAPALDFDISSSQICSFVMNRELQRSDALFGITQQRSDLNSSTDSASPLCFSPQPVKKVPAVPSLSFDDITPGSLTASGMSLSVSDDEQQSQPAGSGSLISPARLPQMDSSAFHFADQPNKSPLSPLRFSSSASVLPEPPPIDPQIEVNIPPLVINTESNTNPDLSPSSSGGDKAASRRSMSLGNSESPKTEGSVAVPQSGDSTPDAAKSQGTFVVATPPPTKTRWTAATRRPTTASSVDTVLLSLDSSRASGLASPTGSYHQHGMSFDSAAGTPGGLSGSARMKPIITGRHRQFILDDEGNVKYATLEMLVKIFTTEQYVDSKLVQPFIVTADLHTPPNKLLDALISRYNIKQPDGMSERKKRQQYVH